MANARKDFAGVQADIFQQLDSALEPGPDADLDVGPELLGALNTAIRLARQRGLSRSRIVDEMNALLPELSKKLTKRQLDKWTAKSTEYSEFPARYLPAFCAATGCDLPQRVLAQSIGMDLADMRDQAAIQLGENLIRSAQLSRERKTLTKTLGGDQ